MIELCCEYLSVRCIWLYAIIISHTRFRVNLHSIVSKMSRIYLLETDAISEVLVKPTGFKVSSETNAEPFSQTGRKIELCCEYLYVRPIWLYVIIMSRTLFRMNLHPIVEFCEICEFCKIFKNTYRAAVFESSNL